MGYYIGLDGGGTFTDGVAMDEKGRLYFAKAPTTTENFSIGMFNVLSALAEECGTTVENLIASTERFSLGTTVGTNLLVERNGAHTGLLATAGHGDSILMMRGSGRITGLDPELYFHPQATSKPEPLVPRNLIKEINERIDYQGQVVVPVNVEEVEAAVRSLVDDQGVTAIAVSFLWSFRNPAHEEQVVEIIKRIAPEVYVSCSHQVAPRMGEYERTVATVINSYIAPKSAAYFASAAKRLHEAGLNHPLLIMQVSGGILPAKKAVENPLTSLGSGPVGGLIGSAALARSLGHDNVIATDMGGTSFEVGLIVNGEPLVTDENVIDQYRYKLLQLQTTSIACGGGSLARLSPFSKSIRVGPASAGASPGPVCYRRGGTEPTVTDADVVLGLLSAESFLGGRMPLDREGARQAIGLLGKEVGLNPEEAAAGIMKINSIKAAELIRQQTVIRGYDPRDFHVYAYGGAGPLHAFMFAQELGVKGVVIPLGNGASTLSAFGCATSNLVRYFEAEEMFNYPFQLDQLNGLIAKLEKDALDALAEMGKAENITLERFGQMRYGGQWLHNLLMRLPEGNIGPNEAEAIIQDFSTTYDTLYGSGAGQVSQGVELFSVLIRATAHLHRPDQAVQEQPVSELADTTKRGTRTIFWPDQMTFIESQIYDGRYLRFGNLVTGPAVVELPHTSIPVGLGQTLECDAFGNLVLQFKQETKGLKKVNDSSSEQKGA
ncbi:MAG: hydantoinase/oxoprolinase family protein [Clostridia bacterium]|nr:hydantoinase/oxoprolinase family protein [Clostridia bacterium]